MSLFKFVETETLEIGDGLFQVNINQPTSGGASDTTNSGFIGNIWNGSATEYHGVYRDFNDSGIFKFFDGVTDPISTDGTSVISGLTGFALADVSMKDITATGDVTVTGDLTVNGTTFTVNTETLLVEDNVVVSNTAATKEDGGFVVCRIPSNIVASDIAKESGTASAAGTTTTITLQAANGHGTVLDYYKGWVIDLGGDVSGIAVVTTSSAADPPVLTLDTAASGATSTSTTYELYNKHKVGMIWDESTDKLSFYGFPREDVEAVFDTAGDSGNGNLADYMDIKVNDLEVTGGITGLTFVDNILPVNTLGTDPDGGFVVCRSGNNVVGSDTAKETGTAQAGTATTIQLQAANGHSTNDDFYNGWYVRITGGTGASADGVLITDYTGATLTATVDSFPGGTPDATSVYGLYNKRYVGTIWDEATDSLRMYGFPREDGISDLDTAATDGSAPELMDLSVDAFTAANGITATAGDITATTGNVVVSAGDVNVTTGDVNVTAGDLTVTAGNATIGGTLSVTGNVIGELNVEDNFLPVNVAGTSNDGGFLVCRSPANIVAADTAKESGTASAAGTTTTITLQAANSHGTTLDYYQGWVIDLGGDVTGTATVLSSTAADPPVLTLDTAASGATSTSTTYNLYNKRYASMIYDESADEWTIYGFPREAGEDDIDTADAAGNVADVLDFHVNNITIDGTLTVEGGQKKKVLSVTGPTTFTTSQILENDVILIDPASNGDDFDLPAITALGLSATESTCVTIINVDPTNISADIVPNAGASDTIEDDTIATLKRTWQKMTLIATGASGSANTWMIE